MSKELTNEDWEKAGDLETLFSGKKFPIKVSEEMYCDMLGVLPPQERNSEYLKKTARTLFNLWNLKELKINEVFLVGEASDHVNGKAIFKSWASTDNGFYYLGKLPSSFNEVNA